MNKDYLAIIESIFGDIRDNNDNPDLVSGLLSQLKNNINEFFADIKKYVDDWLVSDYTNTTLTKIYNALDIEKYNDVKAYIAECATALTKYKEYLEGLEGYIKTVFGVQEDDGVGIDAIKDKNCFVFDKNEEYIDNLFNSGDSYNGVGMSLSDSINDFEMIIGYLNQIDTFRNECLSLAEVLDQEYKAKSNSELFLMKSAASGIYLYSVLYFNRRLVRELTNNFDNISWAIDAVDKPPIHPVEYRMF